MAFRLFQDLFTDIDQFTATYVSGTSAEVASALTVPVTTGLTLTFIVMGLSIIRGLSNMPFMEFLVRSLKIAMVVAVALGSGLYQGQIATAIRTTPDALASAIMPGQTDAQEASQIVDAAAEQGFQKSGEAFEKVSLFEENGLMWAVFGLFIMVATVVFVAIGGAFLILAKLGLAMLAALGPAFILALLWQPTQKLFDLWLGQVLNFTLLVVLFAGTFGLMLSFFTNFIEGVRFDNVSNIVYNVGGVAILSVGMLVALMQIPGLAAVLGGGIATNMMGDIKNAVNGIKSGADAVGGAASGAADKAGSIGAGLKAYNEQYQSGGSPASARQAGLEAARNYYKGKAA